MAAPTKRSSEFVIGTALVGRTAARRPRARTAYPRPIENDTATTATPVDSDNAGPVTPVTT